MSEDVAAPTGEVTFLFTDVEGSTRLWELDGAAMEVALAEHDRRLRAAFAARRGYVFTTAGDSFAVAFASAADALAAGVEAQLRLIEPCAEVPLRIRMGMHTGAASARDGDYFGAAVNRCARLMSAAHGGQILVSGATERHLPTADSGGYELTDFGEHRLKDLLQPERIYQVRHSGLEDRFPPLRTIQGPTVNLPIQLTSFVGREAELAEVSELLSQHRLVTLTGSGGAGKTRLSYQVAAESLESFPDGIRVVELATVSDAELIHDVVADVVGATAAPEVPMIQTISDRVGTRRLLLVLDNSEQLAEAVASMADALLRSCPELKVLATSRARLGGAGEVAYRVPSLAMPEERGARPGADRFRGSGVDSTPVEQYVTRVRDVDSVRLFTQRAVLARPDFAVTADNVDDIVSICRRLDGIPLALELAAARMKVLSPMQVAKRLNKEFDLLEDGSIGALDRHRTLSATIAWSYDHLPEPEQEVFRRASVFAGYFGIDAAETICAGGDVTASKVLNLISALVDKSMLVPDHVGHEVRYRMLESMRHYGAERLGEGGETDAVASDHATYFTEFVEQLQADQRSGDLGAALAGLDRDIDNVRVALRFLLNARRLEEAARMVGAAGYLWYASGRFREGIEWCWELFEAKPDLPDTLQASALHSYATILGSWAQPDAALEMMAQQIELRRRIGDPARLAAALNNIGNMQNDLGHTEEGEASLREAIDQFRAADQPATLALASLGYACRDARRYADGAALFGEALDEASRANDEYGVALARSGLGECAVHQGWYDLARPDLTTARTTYEQLGVFPGVAYCEVLLAIADIAQARPVDAAPRLAAALADPDAQWYQATKYWILQLAAELLADRVLAAEFVGLAEHNYAGAKQAQPAWVPDHLVMIRDRLRGELGEEAFAAALAAGARTDVTVAIADAVHALGQLAESGGATDS